MGLDFIQIVIPTLSARARFKKRCAFFIDAACEELSGDDVEAIFQMCLQINFNREIALFLRSAA
jgi:hypothetical protein